MVGTTEIMETTLWLQTTEAADVRITYRPKASKKDFAAGPIVQTQQQESYTAHITLENLSPGTIYEYSVSINGEELSFDYPTEFETQELWQWRTDPPEFTLAMGSCLYINEKRFDRPGDPYGGDPAILETIAQQDPDLMLWLGDNIYYREVDFYSADQMDRRYQKARVIPEMQPLLASTINLAIWDDHDYGPNNSDRSYRMREEALEIFKRYWANPAYGTMETPGVFFRYKYADVEFFMLDNRFYRAPNKLDDPEKDYFGHEQVQWLKDALVNSNATFKVVVNGNQMTNDMGGHEAFKKYEQEYNEVMDFLTKEKIEGLIVISGDRHFTELFKHQREDLYPIYEFTSSPLTSGTYTNVGETKEGNRPGRIDGTLVHKQRNFGMIKVTGNREERVLILQTLNKEGEKLWEYKISADELTIE